MKNLIFTAIFATLLLQPVLTAGHNYVGGDISLLPEYEKAGAKYKTPERKVIADLLPWLAGEGMNAMRVRLFVNPDDYTGDDADPNACQDLDYILPICQDIKRHGMALMLDIHYSDTWADPAKQWTPKAWQGLSDPELCEKVHDYTLSVLTTLKEAGATPDFIQTGNEISYGMLWGSPDDKPSDLKKTFSGSSANWQRLADLLKSAGEACRQICPDALIVIHTERVANQKVLKNFYEQMDKLGVGYDIIGLSYYPYFHGNMSTLDSALTMLESAWPQKRIMIVETGYAYAWEVPGTSQEVDYPYSAEGQNQFAKDLVATLQRHPSVDGLFWWWMEYNAYSTGLANWYNAPLFDSRNGRALPALKTICSFADPDSGIDIITVNLQEGLFPDDNASRAGKDYPLFDLHGRPVKTPRPGEILISPSRPKTILTH